MCQCFTHKKNGAIPLFVASAAEDYLETDFEKSWIKTQPKNLGVYIVPSPKGHIEKVICLTDKEDMWAGATAYEGLGHIDRHFYLADVFDAHEKFALTWALAHYKFSNHKANLAPATYPKLYLGDDMENVKIQADAVYLARDLINMPADQLTPMALAERAADIGKAQGAVVKIIKDNTLQTEYPMVWTVGRASEYPPAVVDMAWGNPAHPKVTLIGKGVTFDSGGLDIKPANAMLLMKKDMGGAANALALAHMIMASKLPVYLRVILPCAENAIGSRAFRPSDILKSRKGTTVEVGDTDAEGRLLLADALTAASEEKPDYILDFATLTGVARLAVGTEMGALFANDLSLQESLTSASASDPLWPLPLWQDYRKLLNSDVADIKSCSAGGYGGAITAALFLEHFVDKTIKWAHFDIMAWNISHRPGRPVGGEAMGIRAAYEFIKTLKGKR